MTQRLCFVCAQPLQRPNAMAIRERSTHTPQAVTVRFHQTCAPCLAVAVLECLDPVQRWRAQLAGQPSPVRTRADFGLTRREEEILQRIALGETNRQIAHQLGVTEKRVKNVVSILLDKLGVASRTEAAVIAVAAGLTIPGRTG